MKNEFLNNFKFWMNTFDTFRLYTFDINQSSADITRLLLIRRFPWAKIHIEENAGENTLLGPDVVIFTLVPWIFLWAPETPLMHVIRFTNHRLLRAKAGILGRVGKKAPYTIQTSERASSIKGDIQNDFVVCWVAFLLIADYDHDQNSCRNEKFWARPVQHYKQSFLVECSMHFLCSQ